MFHLSRLKTAIGEYTAEANLPSELDVEPADHIELEHVSSGRIVVQNNCPIKQFLVQWKGLLLRMLDGKRSTICEVNFLISTLRTSLLR